MLYENLNYFNDLKIFVLIIMIHIYKGIYYKHITHYQTYSLDRMALELALIRVKFNLPYIRLVVKVLGCPSWVANLPASLERQR